MALKRLHPQLPPHRAAELSKLWDEVVDRIIKRMLALSDDRITTLHINIRAEMADELGKIALYLSEQVITARIGSRDPAAIDLEQERIECLRDADGMAKIEQTARNFAEGFWMKKYAERWGPKSEKALANEANPKKARLSVKAVDDNHFIPRWFIKRYWAQGERLRRYRKNTEGVWESGFVGAGGWAYRKNLYSHEREAYFQLVEGDATRPIEKLLSTSPLTPPEQEALIGYIVIQIVRSPFFIEQTTARVEAMVPEAYRDWDAPVERKPFLLYDSLFQNNALYDQVARPLFWSEWALVKSASPIFVLPDVSMVRVQLDNGEVRVIVPLSPHICFVTLPSQEAEKRIVPYWVQADDALAQDISALLVGAAREEFATHPDFDLVAQEVLGGRGVLARIATASKSER